MKDDPKDTGLRLLEKGKRGIFRVIFSRSGLILVLLAVQVLFLFSIFHWFEAFLPHIYGGVVLFTVFMVLYLLNSSMDPTVLLAVQVLFLFSIFHWFEAFLPHIYGGVVLFTVFMVLYLLNSSMDPTSSIFHWFEAFLPHIYGGVVLFTVFMVLYLLNSSMDPTSKITWLVVSMLLPVFGALLFLYTQKNIGHRALQNHYAQLNRDTADSLNQDPDTQQALKDADPGAAAMAHYIRRSGCYRCRSRRRRHGALYSPQRMLSHL